MKKINHYMYLAIEQARIAESCNEVPIGAVLIDPEGNVKQSGHNLVISNSDPTAHAELNVIRRECQSLKNERLTGYSLFVTLEPCPMCATAISFARISKIFYGASDRKSGGVEVGPKIFTHSQSHHKPEIIKGINQEICSNLLKNFFKMRR